MYYNPVLRISIHFLKYKGNGFYRIYLHLFPTLLRMIVNDHPFPLGGNKKGGFEPKRKINLLTKC
jgi:hypothetical protein